mgnify:CR=1 FL=1
MSQDRDTLRPLPGFQYSRLQFEGMVDAALAHARRLGASDAGAEASEGCGLSVSVRKGELENIERNRDKSLGITVYLGQRRGSASTSDFSPEAIERTVQAAYDIARFTAEDPAAGLPDEQDIAHNHPDLGLFHPWDIDSEGAAELALRCEAAALATDPRISNSEGAAVSAQQSHFFSAHTRGFEGGYASTRHTLSVAPIAVSGDDMQPALGIIAGGGTMPGRVADAAKPGGNVISLALDASLTGRLGPEGYTLVVTAGEFGRTPRINASAGRDHWPQAQSILVAGGGYRHGQVVGSTDSKAEYPTSRPLSPNDFCAIFYHALGISPDTTIRDHSGRPNKLLAGGEMPRELL